MNILITGSEGFIAKNLIVELNNRGYKSIFKVDKQTESELLEKYCKKADFVFHLAGVNRSTKQSDFMEGNFGFTSDLLSILNKCNNKCPVLISSSIQAKLDNPYGKSKKAGEELLREYSTSTGADVYIYRFPNVFGKWSRPNYNSVIATFCYNISRDLPIKVNDPDVLIRLAYIDDVINELIKAMEGNGTQSDDFYEVPITYSITLSKIVELIKSFKISRENKSIPNLSNDFTKNLHSTFLSYLPEDKFSYDLKMNNDERGSFTEFIKTSDRGQVSVNISKPGITKGNHWHHTKNEKFLVVSGKGVIRLRKIDSTRVLEYFVSSNKLEVVDIPVGYTHNIKNLGDTDMVTIMWVNEPFDLKKPDTYFLEV